MRDMIKMIVVLTLISATSGGLLSSVRNSTEERIENQILKYQKAPAIKEILSNVINDPLQDRFSIKIDDKTMAFFPGKLNNGSKAVAFETKGQGFGGDIGLMIAIDLKTDKIVGARVTTHSETPGLGSRAKDNTKFISQFTELSLDKEFKTKKDNGNIDAISGATVTSKGVCIAVEQARNIYIQNKDAIINQVNKVIN